MIKVISDMIKYIRGNNTLSSETQTPNAIICLLSSLPKYELGILYSANVVIWEIYFSQNPLFPRELYN